MARRSRKKKSPSTNIVPIIIISLFAAGLCIGGYFVITRDKESNATELNAETYINSPDSVRGSTFSVKVEVVRKLYYKEGETQLLHVLYHDKPISIIVPADVKGPNINTQQEYTFIVKAKNDAWLVASSYTDK